MVVPVGGMSRLTQEGISAALSLGDEVIAVTVCYTDPDDDEARLQAARQWDQWDPGVPLVTLHSTARRSARRSWTTCEELERAIHA